MESLITCLINFTYNGNYSSNKIKCVTTQIFTIPIFQKWSEALCLSEGSPVHHTPAARPLIEPRAPSIKLLLTLPVLFVVLLLYTHIYTYTCTRYTSVGTYTYTMEANNTLQCRCIFIETLSHCNLICGWLIYHPARWYDIFIMLCVRTHYVGTDWFNTPIICANNDDCMYSLRTGDSCALPSGASHCGNITPR